MVVRLSMLHVSVADERSLLLDVTYLDQGRGFHVAELADV